MNNSVVAVIMVNYCTADLVIRNLHALLCERQLLPNLYAIIVDNASPDESANKLKAASQNPQFASWVKIIPADKNGGFSYGNNLGFSSALSWLQEVDYFWMLNPDIEVLPNCATPLLQHLNTFPRSIAGGSLQDRDGTKQVSAFNFPSMISEICSGFKLGIFNRLFQKFIVPRSISDITEQCDWLSGACLMFSTKTFTELGIMDENYFLYYEEVDYLKQAYRKGIYCYYIPASKAIHEIGASTGISDIRKRQPRRPLYWFESRRYYFLKNHGYLYLLITDTLWVIAYISWILRKKIFKPSDLSKEPPYFLSDFIRSSLLNPSNWFKAKHSLKK